MGARLGSTTPSRAGWPSAREPHRPDVRATVCPHGSADGDPPERVPMRGRRRGALAPPAGARVPAHGLGGKGEASSALWLIGSTCRRSFLCPGRLRRVQSRGFKNQRRGFTVPQGRRRDRKQGRPGSPGSGRAWVSWSRGQAGPGSWGLGGRAGQGRAWRRSLDDH